MSILLRFTGVSLLSVLLLVACQKKEQVDKKKTSIDSTKGTYFSLRQFADDQFHTYHGYPFAFTKVTVVNGVKDSVIENINTVDWGFILKSFFDADISPRKYLGQYDFTMFEDDMTQTRNFWYQAKDPGLFTQKLQISADQFTNRIRSIYIETEKHSSFKEESQKLYYSPVKVIQIQQYEKSGIGKASEHFTEYRFM